MWGMVQQRLCLTCTNPFEVPATSKRRYCSTGCQPPQRPHSRKAKPLVEVECAKCGKKFERKQWEVERRKRLGWAHYCSVDCRDAVKRGRQGEHRVERIKLECEYCARTFEVAPHESKRRRFCSKGCARRSTQGRPPEAGLRILNGDGYVFVYVPKEERPPGQEQIARHPEHRVVMAEMLGRWPTSRESVHHINGDKTDNRPENLQLRSGSHGRGHVLRCRACGSSDIEHVELD
jgi:hypothetical protein